MIDFRKQNGHPGKKPGKSSFPDLTTGVCSNEKLSVLSFGTFLSSFPEMDGARSVRLYRRTGRHAPPCRDLPVRQRQHCGGDSPKKAYQKKKTGRNNTGCRRKKQLPEQYGNSRMTKAETFFPHRHILVRKHRSRETGIPAQNFCRPVAPYGHETGHRRNRNRYLYRPFCRAPFRSIHGKKPQGDR